MSYQTVEVELDHGRVSTVTAEPLPEKARALLTILSTDVDGQSGASPRTLGERVPDLAGIGQGLHTDLSTNRRHLDDFGR